MNSLTQIGEAMLLAEEGKLQIARFLRDAIARKVDQWMGRSSAAPGRGASSAAEA